MWTHFGDVGDTVCGPYTLTITKETSEAMTDPTLMRGDGWVRCCMCGALHEDPYPDLAVDTEGNRWDMCSGECAASGGIVEAKDE